MNEIITKLITEFVNLRVLIIAYQWPAVLNGYDGSCLYIGNWGGGIKEPSKHFSFSNAPDAKTVEKCLLSFRKGSQIEPFDLVIIDHDHRLTSVAAQFNLARSLAKKEAVFILDDAVPSSVEMAGERPTQGWWVGQVWLMTQLLRPQNDGGFILTVDAAPTGVMIASGCCEIEEFEVRATLQSHGKPSALADITRLFSHASADVAIGRASERLAEMTRQLYLPIRAAQQEDGLGIRKVIDLEIQRQHQQPDFVLDLSKKQLNTSSLFRATDSTPGKTIDTFEDIYAIGHANFYCSGLFLSRTIKYGERLLERFTESPRHSQVEGLFRATTGFKILKECIEGATEITGSCLFGTPDEVMNWGMWLIYGVPSAMHFIEHRDEFQRYFCYVNAPWQINLLTYLGVPEDVICKHDIERTYRFHRLSLIRHTFRNLSVPDSDRCLYRRLAEQIVGTPASGPGRKIFVSRLSRSKSGSYRSLINEEELAIGLSQLGFDVVEPEFLSFPEQVQLFYAADVVVALGGAGLFNVVFCKKGTKVVTIESSMAFVGSHSNIMATMELGYGIILGEEDPNDPRRDHKRWTIDVQGALQEIKRFIA